MHLLNVRALIPLFFTPVLIAAACGGSNRDFGSGSAGTTSGDAGESGNSGSSNSGGGAAGHAGKPQSGAGNAGTTGTDAGTTGADAGAGGESGAPAVLPECGAPGTACCADDMCVANASCSASSCGCAVKFSACGAGCVDFQADPKNCGSCGHNCLGGACDLGSCQPVPVVGNQTRVNLMVTDGKYLYWTGADATGTTHYVARRRVDASDAVKVIAPNEKGGYGLALSGDKVYWLALGHLRVCDLPDCATGPSDAIASVSPTGCGYGMLFEPTKKGLYWSCGSTYNQKNGTLFTLAAASTTPAALGTNPSNPGTLVKDVANVYWINSSTYTADNLNADGGLWRVRLSDGVTTQLVSGLRGDISHLAIGGNALYFSGNIQIPGSNPIMFTQAVLRAPLPNGLGGLMLPKFADAKNVYGMVADDQHLYYVDGASTTGAITRCPIAACPSPEVIVPGLENPTMGTQDSVSIYWKTTTYMPGGASTSNIERLAK